MVEKEICVPDQEATSEVISIFSNASITSWGVYTYILELGQNIDPKDNSHKFQGMLEHNPV